MPYDEILAQNKIREISLKIIELSNTEHNLRTIEKSLRSILNVSDFDTKTNLEKKTKPNDPGTGKPISDKRRDEVFDSMILEADKLLGA